MSNYLSTGSEWTFGLLKKYETAIAEIAGEYHLKTYPNQIEVITAEQMMDAYSTVGMPLGYHHWSYGKQFLNVEKRYKRGEMGLAYEIVINSDPCIAYLMEENTVMMQALVIAHASYGHNSFFRNNYLFRTWTSADSIIDYLVFARNYIRQCEERYGEEEVEIILDSCHALMNYGVDRYKRPPRLSADEELVRIADREEYLRLQHNEIWRTLPPKPVPDEEDFEELFPSEPQENFLYFIEKNAPLLEGWQREIVRIVRKIAQYFYPQRQTQVMNEGWACFWHYTLVNDLYNRGQVDDGFMVEFLKSHTNVLFQPDFDHPYYSGINPYSLGYAIMTDIRRICENPTDEDKQWFPKLANTNWLKQMDFAMRNFKDESFIAQYLSPKVIRELKLFSVLDDDQDNHLVISAIHDDAGYQHVRHALSEQYNLGTHEPNLQIYNVNRRGDRSLTLRHMQHNRRPLGSNIEEIIKHLVRLWGFTVRIDSVYDNGNVELTHECRRDF